MYRGLVAFGLVLVIFGATASPTPLVSLRSSAFAGSSVHIYPLPARADSPQVDEALEVTVLNLINQERLADGLPPLMPHATIQRAARAHGREMFAWGYLTHLSRDGRTPQDRVLGLGVRVHLIGENLAYAADARAAHDALMASDAHRRNILFPQYQLIGIAVIDGGSGGVIVVEDFSDEGVAYHLPKWWDGSGARPAVLAGPGH
jgi:uncharacterized protein YkwD